MQVRITRKIENKYMGIVFAESGEIVNAEEMKGEALAGAQCGLILVGKNPDFPQLKLIKIVDGTKYCHILRENEFEVI